MRLPAPLAASLFAAGPVLAAPNSDCVAVLRPAMTEAAAAEHCTCLYTHPELRTDPTALAEVDYLFWVIVAYARDHGMQVDEVMALAADRDRSRGLRPLRRAREDLIDFIGEAGDEAGCVIPTEQ